MDPERAEAHLRLLAEAELRRPAPRPGNTRPADIGRVARVAQVLTAVGALDATVVTRILDDFVLGVGARQDVLASRLGRLLAQAPPLPRPARSTPVATGRVVPIGQLIPIRDGEASGEVYLLSYVQRASRGLLTMIARGHGRTGSGAAEISLSPFTATDDYGGSYGMGLHGSGPGGPGGWILRLHPDPPRDLRWLDLTATPGEPAVRIDVAAAGEPDSEVTVRPAGTSPGEHLLTTIATRLLAAAAAYPREVPLRVAQLSLGLAVDGLGDIVEALQACEAVPPLSPVPAQLATLCAYLNVSGHGITTPPADTMPEPWRRVLFHYRGGRRAPGPAGAAVAVALPELDGISLTILGLHDSGDGTVMYLHAAGAAWDDGLGELTSWPVIWLRDSGGWWHATGAGAGSADQDREITMEVTVVPPLSRDSEWIEVIAAGVSAEARVTLPVRWG